MKEDIPYPTLNEIISAANGEIVLVGSAVHIGEDAKDYDFVVSPKALDRILELYEYFLVYHGVGWYVFLDEEHHKAVDIFSEKADIMSAHKHATRVEYKELHNSKLGVRRLHNAEVLCHLLD